MRNFRLICVLVLGVVVVGVAADLKQIAMIDLPGAPGFNGMAMSRGMLLISHGGAGTVDIFDMQRRRVVAQIKDLGDVKGIVADEKSGTVYIANTTGKSIEVVSAKDWKVTDTIALHTQPYALALSGDGATLYVANWRDLSISAIDVTHGFRVRTEQVGGTPHDLVFDHQNKTLYATLDDRAEVIAVDPDLKVTKRFKLFASMPTGLALDSAAGRVYVAVRHAVSALDLNTGSEVGRVAAPAGAHTLWLDQGSGTLYVAAADGTIAQIRATATDFQRIDDVKTDVRGTSIAFDASRGFLYIPGGFEGKSKLVIMKKVTAGQSGQAAEARNSVAQ